ncbi:putative esterase of the alpha-beta hydrolase superfamily protein [Flavobacterium enshiense DK69]|uniref:Patatin n=1 Tax=Flavobacterium enshiense DK69 TaxID=1107311 RepID=V6S9K1_9FLAO|nr:patatin-like phospholipase family protein [Flavobacterium enshiense]ESU23114.1 putative esterase of the alpha-beta hydrolase superfamily protein [Flavobacterium enshiense DK69]KGO96023.1 patatin [Flavobacterium enshiense DK69]
MKKTFCLFILLFSLCISLNLFAQDKKPKVVLVLSGGGAKGIAHIPLLQKLDSLHIVPDLIIGNSMGSIIGGLYAMGYSGDSIASITKNIDWDKILGGGMSLRNVSVDEKREFQRYLAGIGIKDGKTKSTGAILNDQNLREYLFELTYPVYNVKDFDNLPIPFRAMATDLVEGKEVVLSKGSLAFAMRASMSLPAVFKPMPYEDTVLVDGGVMNNFPTDIAKQMGADIIIGSDVGGGMEPKEKLDNFATVLMQTSTFPSNIKNPDNRALCNILVDHLPNLRFSTADFGKSDEIYNDGKIAASKNLPALTALAEKIKGHQQRTHQLPNTPNVFLIDTIIYKNISKENMPLVIARTNLKSHTKYTPKDLIAGVNRAMGINLFNQITYNYFINEEGKLGIILNGFEQPKNQLNASVHYDTYRGVGLILNYTARNVLAQSSRLLITADIAEQPKGRIQFQKNFGKKKDWWWASELYAAFLKQEVFIDGNSVDNMLYDAIEFNNEFNRNINPLKNYIGFGLNYNYAKIKPKYDPYYNPNVFFITKYIFNSLEVNMHYSYNDMDKVFFATNGTILKANVNRSILTDVTVTFIDPNIANASDATNGYTKLGFGFEKRVPLKKKINGMIGFDANYIFQDKLKNNQLSFTDYGYASKYFLGGIIPFSGSNRFTFPGLNEDELNVTQFTGVKLGAQINPIGKFYLTPHLNIATVGFATFNDYIDNIFNPKGNWDNNTEESLVMSAGASVSYQSILGPIHFDTSWINDVNKARVFFSVGLSFNP